MNYFLFKPFQGKQVFNFFIAFVLIEQFGCQKLGIVEVLDSIINSAR